MDRKKIAKWLKTQRQELNMTQKEFASYCNVHHNTVQKIELEKEVKDKTLQVFLDKLGFKVKIEFISK